MVEKKVLNLIHLNGCLKNAPRFGFESPQTLRDGKGVEEAWHIQWIKINEIWG